MRCLKCQAENREGRRFCAECGRHWPLPVPRADFQMNPARNFVEGAGSRSLLRSKLP